MGQNQDTRVFNGVMDQDSAPFTISESDVRYRLNLVNLYNDNGFASNENIQGFEMVSNSYLSTSRNKCIGAFEDVRGNSIIYFVWAEDKTHGIYRWYQNKGGLNGQLEKVYQGSVLGFEEYHRISHCSLVDELLIYTDGYGSPKSLNIERMNLTDKRKVFNIYFDQSAFGSPTTYTLDLYVGTGYSFSWTSAATDYIGRVDDFILAAQADVVLSSYCMVSSKVNFAQLAMNEAGDFMINISPSVYCIAENFYPDTTTTPVSYAPMSEELITAVKYPPFKAPSVKYGSSLGTSLFNATLENFTFQEGIIVDDPSDPTNNIYPNSYFNMMGISNVIIDTASAIVQGSSAIQSYINPSVYYQPSSNYQIVLNPLAYIQNPFAAKATLNITFDFTMNVNSTLPLDQLIINFGKFVGVGVPQSPVFSLAFNTQTTSFSKTISLRMDVGDKYFIWIGLSAYTGTIGGSINGVITPIGVTSFITNKTLKFRNRYVYKDNQESVLGAESIIPLPLSPSENLVEVDYSDDRLSSIELVSDIKEVVMSVSEDNGTTWYDWKTLYPYQFVGSGTKKVNYFGNETLIPIDSAKAILPYHNIPLTAKSQEFIDDRIFYGAILTGYNKIQPKYRLELKGDTFHNDDYFYQSIPPNSLSYWKVGGEYNIGIVYYDDADRKTPVLIDPETCYFRFPYYTDNDPNFEAFPYLQFSINSEPPPWATKYQWVRTKDLTNSQFLQWVTDDITFLTKEGVVVTNPALQSTVDTLKISFANIPYYSDKWNTGAKVDFPYVDGDRIRFIYDKLGQAYLANDYQITKVDGTDVYIKYDGYLGIPGTTPFGGQLVELYSISTKSDSNPFYEFSECYAIKESTFNGVTKKYHTGDIADQSYGTFAQNSTPAQGLLRNGDIFSRRRIMPYSVTTTPVEYENIIQSNSPSEYISANGAGNQYDNNGRVNSTELLGQVYQPTGVVFSNRYISGTKINGLNAVEAANTRQYSTIYGDLNKMQVVNNDVLKFIFGNGYQLSIYVNQGVIRQSGGASNLISIYDDVAGNSHLIQRTLGTQNAESVVLNDEGDVFGWDETEGVDWLSASNATLQVSDYKMKNTFGNYGLQRRKLDTHKSNAPAVYDLYRDLMILTLAPLQARQFIAPKATVKLADLDSLGWNIQVIVQPQGLVQTYTTPPSVSWYDIVRDALPTTYGMAQNTDGSFDVSAPDYTNYKDSVLILSGTSVSTGITTTMTYQFQGGQEASNEPAFSGVTLAYSRKLKGWVTYFSFLPEMYGRLRNQVASFKDGQLWLHDKASTFNNFYGTNYPSELRFVLNKDYPKVKSPLSVWYRGLGNWGAIVRYTPNNMETEMIPSSFRLQENGYSASVTRDRNDPRFTDPQQAWVNGQEIRGDAVEIALYNNDLSQARIDSQKSVYLYSELS